MCGAFMEVTLRSDQWDDPPPECPRCNVPREMQQEFKPVAIGGSNVGKAHALAEKIAAEDYGVADLKSRGDGEAPKVRYKESSSATPSTWGASAEALAAAAANGRHTRIHHGDGLDVLRSTLKTGAQPDLFKHAKLIT
jgi:hypothetical protein